MLRSTIGKAKILIVDDEPANVRLLERILELIGATHVESITDSRQAVAGFVEFRPDLVLLDLHMPHVTGFEVMEQIKALSVGENAVPVLVLTADATVKTKLRALAAGAKDFLTKPLDQTEVLLRIRNLLENRFLHLQLQNHNLLLEEQVSERTAQLEDTLGKLRHAQHAAIKQERLSALGTMAAGIAHDFNNALTLILGYSDLLLSQRPERPAAEAGHIRAIATAAQDAAHIVRRLREFHRTDDGTETRVPLLLNTLAEQAAALTSPRWRDHARTAGLDIEMRLELGELPPVLGDPAELREMLTNLIFNAVDAMPRGGAITVQTTADDGDVCLSVADTGTGMDEETRRRCLEPFYTTKGERGTGLGLSAVYGIVERHRGSLEIESEPGRGTRFVIRLPAAPAGAVAPAASAMPGLSRRRILLLDDQEAIRDVICRQLAGDGHEVHAVEDCAEALERLAANAYDLLITDHTMPGMSGEELAFVVQERHPRTAVILLTGLGGMGIETADLPPGVDLVLGKPATAGDLRRAIGQVRR